MKDLSVIVIILLLVFVPGYYSEIYLKKSGEEIVNMLEKVEEEVKFGNMDNFNKVEEIKKKWEKEQELWNILSNHQNTDDVQKNIEIMLANYENKEADDVLANIAEIRFILEDVPKGEKIRIVNIF